MTTVRTWTDTGEQLHDRVRAAAEGHNWLTRDELAAAIAALEWEEPGTFPGMAGLAIKAVINDVPLRAVTAVAVGVVECYSDNEPGPSTYGLYGIRNRYSNGVAEIFVVDRGSDALIVASDFPIEGD